MADNFLSNKNLRAWHRDLGYIFVGLIIAFSISGITQNHRKQWKPDRYVYEFRKTQTNFHLPKESVTKDSVMAFNKQNNLLDFRQFDLRKDSTLVISYKDADATIHLIDGKAEINIWKKKPVLAQMNFLHKYNGNNFWIWYSDFFALALLFIAVSGLFLMRGKNSFRKRGWWLALIGLIVPITILIMFY